MVTRSARARWLKALAVEAAAVGALLVVIGYFYLWPASSELLRGNAKVMVGDGTDSVTNPWQYSLVLDVLKTHPQDLLFGAIYTDQVGAPNGYAAFIPWIERLLVLFYAPFLRPDLMPTAIAWGLMVLSGLCMHAYGRVLGWPRVVAFALAIAWAFSPYTRARALVHIALVGTYWVPLVFISLHLLARRGAHLSKRGSLVAAALMMLFAAFCAHYYVMVAAIMAPMFLLYYLLQLPRDAWRIAAAGRLALAVAPAALFVAWSYLMPVPSYGARALAEVVPTRSETDFMTKVGGAHPIDYVLGDVKLGDADLIPPRSRLTRRVRDEVKANLHERTNGIRWSVLACCAALAVALGSRRLRRRLSPAERTLAVFAFALGAVAFLFALSPQELRVLGVDLGPIQLVTRHFPRFRVPNRIGLLVQFAALLGAGVLPSRASRGRLDARTTSGIAFGVALPALMLLDYAPLQKMLVAPVIAPRTDLEAAAAARGATCGAGLTVPFVTWGFHDEDYYATYASLRRTSCKILHTGYLTREDETLRIALGKPTYDAADRQTAERLARCAGASWVLFRLDVPEDQKRAFCDEMGWPFVASDACRAPSPPAADTRSLKKCIDDLGIGHAP